MSHVFFSGKFSSSSSSLLLIMKQILTPLRQNHACLPKARGIKQSEIVGLISKLKSSETRGKNISFLKFLFKDLESSKQHSIWIQIKEYLNIQYLIFKYLTVFHFFIFPLAIRPFENKIKNVNLLSIFSFFLLG